MVRSASSRLFRAVALAVCVLSPSIVQAAPLSGTINLSEIGTTRLGATFSGANGEPGFAVSNAGDFNGDGFDDFLIGAPGSSSFRGQAYLVYGRSGGSPLSGTINLSNVGTSVEGVVFTGINSFDNLFFSTLGDQAGHSVSAAGDVNGDGIADILIGTLRGGSGPGRPLGSAGEAYVVYGQAGPAALSGAVNLDDIGTSVAGVTLFGEGGTTGLQVGKTVSSAGDVNGDGLADFLLGGGNGAFSVDGGTSVLVYGQTGVSSLTGVQSVATLLSSGGAVRFDGVNSGDNAVTGNQIGAFTSVSSAGDVNGDGFDDLLIGEPGVDRGALDTSFGAGETYLVYGGSGAAAPSGTISLGDVGTTVAGASFLGVNQVSDNLGFSVSNAGDVNGDGLADLLIGAAGANAGAGQTYLIYGRSGLDALSGQFDLANPGPGIDGVVFNGISAGDTTNNIAVSGAGDVNGDGIDDLLIGAWLADGSNGDLNAGQAYLVFGKSGVDALSGVISLSDIGLGTDGAVFSGINISDFAGFAVSNAGDVNGDGFDDFLIGAHRAQAGSSPGSPKGQTFLIYGQSAIVVTPEPGTFALVGLGLLGAVRIARRRTRRRQ